MVILVAPTVPLHSHVRGAIRMGKILRDLRGYQGHLLCLRLRRRNVLSGEGPVALMPRTSFALPCEVISPISVLTARTYP
eukprot:4104162-Pyramimonas_sp.AAC.1